MVGATLGVAVLGLLFAISGGETGYRLAFLVGGCAELIGAALAFSFIAPDALRKKVVARLEPLRKPGSFFSGLPCIPSNAQSGYGWS